MCLILCDYSDDVSDYLDGKKDLLIPTLSVFCKQFYGFMRVLAPARKGLLLQYGKMALSRIIWLVSNSVRNSKLTEPVGLANFSSEMVCKVFCCFALAAVHLQHFHSVMGLVPDMSAKDDFA